MATQHEAWEDVQISPPPESALAVGDQPGKVVMVNNSSQKLAFKLKTTRLDDIKPDIGVGILLPNGGKAVFNVDYKASPTARPFSDKDHITVLVHECPKEVQHAAEYWKSSNPKDSHRFVFPLKPPAGAPIALSASNVAPEPSPSEAAPKPAPSKAASIKTKTKTKAKAHAAKSTATTTTTEAESEAESSETEATETETTEIEETEEVTETESE